MFFDKHNGDRSKITCHLCQREVFNEIKNYDIKWITITYGLNICKFHNQRDIYAFVRDEEEKFNEMIRGRGE